MGLFRRGEVREWLKSRRIAGVRRAAPGARSRDPEERASATKGLYYNSIVRRGEVREWLKRSASKADIPERVSGVQIPPSPPDFLPARFAYIR